jgi:hypothetical protein
LRRILLFSVLLCVSVVLFSNPMVIGDSNITYTTTSVEGSYSRSVSTSIVTQTLMSEDFSVRGAAAGTCYYMDYSVGLSGGDQVTIELTAKPQISFYVMSGSQFSSWLGGASSHYCGGLSPKDFVLHPKLSVSSYSTDWTVPSSGTYYLIFWNPTQTDISVSIRLTKPSVATHTYTAVSYITHYYTQVSSVAALTSSASAFPPIVLPPSGSVLPYGIVIIAIGIVVGFVIVFGGFAALRSRSHRRTGRPRESRSSGAAGRRAQFCISCGSKLPAGSRFCNSCGTKQP